MHNVQKDNIDELKQMGYERRDVNPAELSKHTIGFFAFAIVCWLLTWGMMKIVTPENADAPAQSVNTANMRMPAAPNPLLQSNATAHEDIARLRENESALASGYSYVDKEKGIVAIPIEKAMEKIVAEGIKPAVEESAVATKGATK